LFGFKVPTTMGTAVSMTGMATEAGTCAFAAAAADAISRRPARCEAKRIVRRISFRVFGGDAKRFQKADVLRRHGQLGNGSAFEIGLVERVLIDLNAERFEKAAIKRSELRVLIAAASRRARPMVASSFSTMS